MTTQPTVGRPLRGLATTISLGASLLLAAACGNNPRGPAAPAAREITLGGLFSLTGNWSSLGRTGQAAMELGIEDVNEYLLGNSAGIRFVSAVVDTRLDPDIALAQAATLRSGGVRLLIGPQSSAEVERLKPFVDSSGMLLISPSSTAGTLSIAGDNVFRFTPADSLESVAVSALMWDDGVRVVVPVWREDAGNIGLQRATRTRFSALGGRVLAGVAYGAAPGDFGATVAAIDTQVGQAVAQGGKNAVAVYLAGFDEVAGLLARAAADSLLGSVRWYGSDGAAHSEAVLSSPTAVDLAIRVGYPNPVFGLEEGARDAWQPLADRIRTRTGLEPDAFALAVHDAVWVAAQAFLAAGDTASVEQLRRALTRAAEAHYGATGWTVLNEAGDRRYGDFDFWAVRAVDGAPRWVRVAQYETRTERLVRDGVVVPAHRPGAQSPAR